MIQQPKLGRKIAAIRKANGLTQEELVVKCNLNVRTLQRIESGEATPRAYTLKLIFEALEYSFEKSAPKRLIPNWIEQFYLSFIDLFNLKTNTMKKLSILTVMLFLVVLGVSSLFNMGNAQNKTKPANYQPEKNVLIDTIRADKFEIAGMFSGWNNDMELVGRDVKCIVNGAVTIKTPLIRLNKETGEIRTPCYTGILINDTIKIIDLKCQPEERIVSHVSISGNAFTYKGKLVFSEKESIKAVKIIIPRD